MKLLEIIRKLRRRRGRRRKISNDDERSGETVRVSSLPPVGKRAQKKVPEEQ